ncbi:MAG: adenosylcobinamide amidohydrolase [Candidatus Accumulibacter sp.]|jgi:adenosylcobinamide amidohydrolase|nr:adenosylcobinamide amidohydrolase [Accumulibacter sp.]
MSPGGAPPLSSWRAVPRTGASLFAVFLFCLSAAPFAAERPIGPLPENLRAQAVVIDGERDGLWEKSLVVSFPEERRALSTSEGMVRVRAAVNHAAHPFLWNELSRSFAGGATRYLELTHERLARRAGAERKTLATMGTAADLDNLAVAIREYGPFTVAALATAGAETNALRAGVDEGVHIEGENDAPHGTINVLLLTNARLSEGALAQAIIVTTEAKTAALEDLRVPSSYTQGAQATGTGTDSVIVVAGNDGPRVTYTGGHSRIGELIGKAVYAAVVEALGKQNGFLLPGAAPFVTGYLQKLKKARAAAEEWLSLIDGGQEGFDAAWWTASALLRQSEAPEAWRARLKETRAALGEKRTRRRARSLDAGALPGLPRGEYMLVEYVGAFERQPEIFETLTLRKDEDGAWRVLRYKAAVERD